MAVIKYNPVPHPVYEVYKCRTMNRMYETDSSNPPSFLGKETFLFRIKLYCIFADGRVFVMFNSSDWIDNVNLMRESGTECSTFTQDIYVSPTSHSDIYNDIMDYVSQTHSDS